MFCIFVHPPWLYFCVTKCADIKKKVFSFCSWTAKQLLVFLNRVFEKGLFKCLQTHSQHKHLLMESVWRNLWSVCHHRSELWCHFVDTHIPTINPSVTSKIWQRQAVQAFPILTSSSWEWTWAAVRLCIKLPWCLETARVCACFFIYCSCETHLPLTERGSSQLGG